MDKLTPREPTPSMVEAGLVWTDFARGVWRAMHDAAPKVEAEPVAFMWQHDETGRTGFCSRFDLENGFESNNPRLKIVGPLYTHPAAPQPAALPEARYTEDEIADACMLAEIPDSKFESLLLVLKGKQ